MFELGDKVVHIRHGAGVVIETRTIVFEGKSRDYFCIQLNDARHTLMIPVENVDAEELRPALKGTQLIEEVLQTEPCELSDNYRARQADIRDKLKSRNPRKLAQALRDLAWLEYTHKLTNTDTRLRDKVIKALARELALKPETTVRNAQSAIVEIVEKAMVIHIAKHAETLPAS
ncbi:MAG: CarD family transcriptional regulator [Anaerolineae bacterium]|nr:CarD family transcriptional regulator [Anaerolineae bacterium]